MAGVGIGGAHRPARTAKETLMDEPVRQLRPQSAPRAGRPRRCGAASVAAGLAAVAGAATLATTTVATAGPFRVEPGPRAAIGSRAADVVRAGVSTPIVVAHAGPVPEEMSQSASNAEPRVGSQTDVQTDAQTDAQTDVQTDVQTDAQTGVQPSQDAAKQAEEPAGMFRTDRLGLFVWLVLVGGAMLGAIALAKSGYPIRIRRLAALDAIEEAIGRATEMGRSVLFVPGIQDMNDIQTVAGITVLGPVARTAAEYDARLEVPTSRSLVMVAARETVQAAHYAAERPETYSDSNITYLTDEQFAYVGAVAGKMVRERPAACFYMGAFYAESLLFAETGNSIGAIQIAGTAEPSQLPFFVAACDYTLIGEEFFAASAYLSGEKEQLGSIFGQDIGKALAIIAIVGGSAIATVAVLVGASNPFGG